jgi:type IV secretory pathway TrbL component
MTSEVPASAASYRGLLALVILLGMLIMIGVGALIGGAFVGAGRRADASAPFLTSVPAAGARIESAELQGNRILMRLTGGTGDELVVLDAASGRVVGRIRLENAP